MYTPNLIPRDVHHLWLHPNSNSTNSTFRTAHAHPADEDTHAITQTYAPPLSSYSSERPGALYHPLKDTEHNSDNTSLIQSDIRFRLQQLRSVRTLGYGYLAPLGVGKTMDTLLEEEEINKRQTEGTDEQGAPTVENLMGEADTSVRNGELEEPFHQETPRAVSSNPQDHQEELNIDDDIPDAEENSYSLAYEDDDDDLEPTNDGLQFERQYDRGFMVSEQYESQEPEEIATSPTTQFVTPVRETREFVQNNLRSFSDSFNTTAEYDLANASINESDLDMTIDE